MTDRPAILLVDDDTDIIELLRQYLSRFRFEVFTAGDADGMRALLRQQRIDLVVLDVMLPGTDGLTLAREIRAQSRLPVIMLTARVSAYDRVLGLEMGADDYMCKPFEPRELVARIQTVLRRTQGGASEAADEAAGDLVSFDGWQLDRVERTVVSPAGPVAALSNGEFRLLNTFLQAPRRLLTRDQLMERARGRAMDSFDRSIDLLVSRLRHKLADEPGDDALIKTVRGAGYVFNARSVQSRPVWRQ